MARALRIEAGSPNNSDIKRRPIGAVVSEERDAEKEIERIPIGEQSMLQKQEEAIIDGKRIDSHYRVALDTMHWPVYSRIRSWLDIKRIGFCLFLFSALFILRRRRQRTPRRNEANTYDKLVNRLAESSFIALFHKQIALSRAVIVSFLNFDFHLFKAKSETKSGIP